MRIEWKVKKFWSLVDVGYRSYCWEWRGPLFKSGYGYFPFGKPGEHGYGWRAHRVAWFLENGDIPSDLLVLHRCNNAKCVNPEHLYLGTLKDNTDDRMRAGHQIRGERHPFAKLTDSAVLEIREYCKTHKRCYTHLAKKYGVSRYTIARANGLSGWTHVKTPV